MSAAIEAIVEEIAQAVAKRSLEIIAEHKFVREPDPLLTCKQAADQLDVSETKVRELVALGHLLKAPGLIEIRIRQSAVDAYGKKS